MLLIGRQYRPRIISTSWDGTWHMLELQMLLPLPNSLSPSRVSTYKECPLAFKFQFIDKLPQAPSPWAIKGTLVHAGLESLFFNFSPPERTLARGLDALTKAWSYMQESEEVRSLGMTREESQEFFEDARLLLSNYFLMEDPNLVNVVGVELALDARIGSVHLKGIIDRLDIEENYGFVVTDYKTGRVPPQANERARLNGVHLYAALCKSVLGVVPLRVQLLYLRDKVTISTSPTEQTMRGTIGQLNAVWSAVEKACTTNDFRPRPSRLCTFCSYRHLCPIHQG